MFCFTCTSSGESQPCERGGLGGQDFPARKISGSVQEPKMLHRLVLVQIKDF